MNNERHPEFAGGSIDSNLNEHELFKMQKEKMAEIDLSQPIPVFFRQLNVGELNYMHDHLKIVESKTTYGIPEPKEE